MYDATMEDLADVCVPGVDAWAASTAAMNLRAHTAAVRGGSAVAVRRSVPTPLRACRARRYEPACPVELLAPGAALASALVLLLMVAAPCHVETERAAHARGWERVTEVAALQRDSLLAAADWPFASTAER